MELYIESQVEEIERLNADDDVGGKNKLVKVSH